MGADDDHAWRVGAYAVCRRGADVLLVRASRRTTVEGRWFLPGGGVQFGEDPAAAVLRELHEETGLRGRAPRLVLALSDGHDRIEGGRLWMLRLIYDVDVEDVTLVHERDGTSDEARWVPLEQVAGIPAMPYVLTALGLSAPK